MNDNEYEALYEQMMQIFSGPEFLPLHQHVLTRLEDQPDPRDRVLAYLKALDQVLVRIDQGRYRKTVSSLNQLLTRDKARFGLEGALVIFNGEENPEGASFDLAGVVIRTGEISEAIRELTLLLREDPEPDRGGPDRPGPQRGGLSR